MKMNIGEKDRAIRIVAGAVAFPSAIIGTPFALATIGVTSTIIGLLGVDLLVTGALGSSPIYGFLGIDTTKNKAAQKSVAVSKFVRKPAAKKRAPARKKAAPKRKRK
ncbi:DUF2892 domain-containing protein [archaeon]|nr:DUF2892 domain-containing protein [archaeon]